MDWLTFVLIRAAHSWWFHTTAAATEQKQSNCKRPITARPRTSPTIGPSSPISHGPKPRHAIAIASNTNANKSAGTSTTISTCTGNGTGTGSKPFVGHPHQHSN